MDRIKARGFKHSLKIEAGIWRSNKQKIINDIKNAFKGGYCQTFHGGDYLELFYPFDRNNIHNGLCQLIVDAGDANITICEICDYEKTNAAMAIFTRLAARWRKEFRDSSMEIKPAENK